MTALKKVFYFLLNISSLLTSQTVDKNYEKNIRKLSNEEFFQESYFEQENRKKEQEEEGQGGKKATSNQKNISFWQKVKNFLKNILLNTWFWLVLILLIIIILIFYLLKDPIKEKTTEEYEQTIKKEPEICEKTIEKDKHVRDNLTVIDFQL